MGTGDASLLYTIGRVHQGLRREMRRRLAEWQLSVQEYTALSVLRSRPGLSNAQLARRALVAPQSMIEILAKLERRGLVVREVGPGHGRIRHASPTPDGLALLARADPIVVEIEERMLADVDAEQRELLQSLLRTAMHRLSGGL